MPSMSRPKRKSRNFGLVLTLLVAMTGGLTTGCSAFLGPVVELASAGLSAAGAYFSYQALKQDPVNVEVLARECVGDLKYIRVPCEERAGLSEATKEAVARVNQLLVVVCGVERPPPLQC